MTLLNDTKIRLCNAYSQLGDHSRVCRSCMWYLTYGGGDLCDKGKAILVTVLAFADMTPVEPVGVLERKDSHD